uniref:LSM domain-containing protein n=1 Tax=Timema douglasi TaxID=61478 RepID=A0A7R8VR83_TIMDO|nr:unnamed protein product [Timema douglasi]
MKEESDSDIGSSSESCELDFTSTNFNPLKVLRSVSIQIPCPTAPIFDNIHSYASRHIHHRHASKQLKANSGEEPSTSGSQDAPQPSRRFLPHQDITPVCLGAIEDVTPVCLGAIEDITPVCLGAVGESLLYVSELLKISLRYVLSALGKEPVLAPRKQRPERNLLTRMRNTTTGPLARLRDCTELRVRVKGHSQDKNRVLPTTRPGSEQDKKRVLPPVQGQSKIRTVLPPVQGLNKARKESYHQSRARASNRLTPTRGLRRQSRLDWLLETGLESRSGVVKVVFPFSLQDDEIKMYRPRSCIPEVVYIRNMKGIRGYCIAFVAAFDKHWNLALEDVTEVWTRPVKRKAVALGKSLGGLRSEPDPSGGRLWL